MFVTGFAPIRQSRSVGPVASAASFVYTRMKAFTMRAAETNGTSAMTRERIKQLVARDAPDGIVRRILARELEICGNATSPRSRDENQLERRSRRGPIRHRAVGGNKLLRRPQATVESHLEAREFPEQRVVSRVGVTALLLKLAIQLALGLIVRGVRGSE